MPVNAPISILQPPPDLDIFIVRGDRFVMSMGFTELADATTIVVQNLLKLIIRRQQRDSQPNILSVNAALEANPVDTVNGVEVDIAATFVLTPDQTSSIPLQGAVYFIEWTDLSGGTNSRVVQGRVRTGD